MWKLSSQALTTLAILAMAWAQVFGVQRGFACSCGGMIVLTLRDHCHGPHDSDAHDEHEEEPCHTSRDHSGCDESHQHPPFVEQLKSRHLDAQPSLASPSITAVVPVIDTFKALTMSTPSAVAASQSWNSDDPGRRRWPQLLCRTLAQLI